MWRVGKSLYGIEVGWMVYDRFYEFRYGVECPVEGCDLVACEEEEEMLALVKVK